MILLHGSSNAVSGVLPQAGVGFNNKTVSQQICDQQQKYGFLEPMDWRTSEMDIE